MLRCPGLFFCLVVASHLTAAEPARPLPEALAKHFAPPAEYRDNLGNYRSPLKFADGRAVQTAADWQQRRQEILADWQRRLGPWPELVAKPRAEVVKEEEREGLKQTTLRLEIAPDRFSDDVIMLTPPENGPFPAVVVVFYDAKTGVGLGMKSHRDFALQLARRGCVALSVGSTPYLYYPTKEDCQLQPLSFHAYEAAQCHTYLSQLPQVDRARIGIVGHSYGGKWAMFAAALHDKFAACCTSDPGIVFDETRSNVNYWEPWYLGFERGVERQRGIPSEKNPRTGPYKQMLADGVDLHELHALIAPRPFLVSGGAEDPPVRWTALNHTVAVNKLLGYEQRVGMTNRPLHDPNEESNAVLQEFFVHFLR